MDRLKRTTRWMSVGGRRRLQRAARMMAGGCVGSTGALAKGQRPFEECGRTLTKRHWPAKQARSRVRGRRRVRIVAVLCATSTATGRARLTAAAAAALAASSFRPRADTAHLNRKARRPRRRLPGVRIVVGGDRRLLRRCGEVLINFGEGERPHAAARALGASGRGERPLLLRDQGGRAVIY